MNKIKEKYRKIITMYKNDGLYILAKFLIKKTLSKGKSVIKKVFLKSKTILTNNGVRRYNMPSLIPKYDAWVKYNQWNSRSEISLQKRLSRLKSTTKISVIMPVYNSPIKYLELAIESVKNQVYSNWEFCIADDLSTDKEVREVLNKWASSDNRIKVLYRDTNGNISNATNSAVSIVTGDFLVFLDHDDVLTPNALAEVAIYLHDYPETDFIYSDEDKIDVSDKRYDPHFKPDWSPELLLSYMYLGHIWGVRKRIYDQVGGMRVGFEGSQDFDFALRATEVSKHVAHLPLVLYHWRAIPGSTAVSGKEKPKSFEAGRQAVQDALDRRKVAAQAHQPDWALNGGLGLFAHKFSDEGPLVTIIIATKNKFEILKTCIDSLENTLYKKFEVLIIDNESDDPKTIKYLRKSKHRVVQISNPNGKFNFAAIHNIAVKEFVQSEYILFLNNDTEAISPDWLSQMMGYMQMPDVGIVGAKLIYPDKRIQHAGIVHGLHHGLAGHAFKLLPSFHYGYGCYTRVVRNYSAVTAACLLTTKETFLSVGGFDENNFAVAYNDVDFCYKVLNENKRIVFCPEAELIHYEGFSRGFTDNPFETAVFKEKYLHMKDSFYNPNLSLEEEQFNVNAKRAIIKGEDKDPLKMLVFTHMLNFTGAPMHQFEIIKKLKKDGKVEPLVLSFVDGPLRASYEEYDIQVIIMDQDCLSNIFHNNYHLGIEQLIKQIIKYDIDVVYANTLQSFFAVYCANVLNIPCVWNVHESLWKNYFDEFDEFMASKIIDCFSLPYKVIFVADATMEYYKELNSMHNFIAIHNGLNYERIEKQSKGLTKESARKKLNISSDEILVLMLGTVCERKGQLDLISALPFLNEEAKNKIRVLIVGDRPSNYSSAIKTMIKTFPEPLQKRITIVQETDEVAQYYLPSDIFVLASREESFPRVIQEAMAFGLPIIATPIFGVKEQIKQNVNGFFYEQGKFEELAGKISLLMNDEILRNKFGKNSIHVLNSLTDFSSMVNAYYEIFYEASFVKETPIKI